MPTENSVINLLALSGITNFEPYKSVGTHSKPVGSGTRREWRIKQETGEIRGVSIREKNKQRKSVGWIDKRSAGWDAIKAEYETWRRKPRYAVGTFEQPAGDYAKQPTGEDTRHSPD